MLPGADDSSALGRLRLDDPPRTLARSDADGFDIALRLRATASGPVHELVVNGMFAMDSTDRSSELALADLADAGASRVLVGGLGLGFTATRVLERCPGARVDVVDLSAALIDWARAGLTATLDAVARHPRSALVAADIADVLRGRVLQGPWDAVLLDVDNGPDFLIHDHNAALYGDDLLADAVARVAPGGVLGIWSERESALLAARLDQLADGMPGAVAGVVIVPVHRDGRRIDYAIHTLRRMG